MRLSLGLLLLAASALMGLTGCASIGPPLPPSLELPHPPADVRAVRKGDKFTFTWTIPARTMDRQSVRYLGRTRICRGPEAVLVMCGAAVGEVAPPADFTSAKETGGKKLTASYVGSIWSGLDHDRKQSGAFEPATCSGEGLNRDERSRGPCNQVHGSRAGTVR